MITDTNEFSKVNLHLGFVSYFKDDEKGSHIDSYGCNCEGDCYCDGPGRPCDGGCDADGPHRPRQRGSR